MDVILRNTCGAPDGLRELCADISREVIRYQPCDIECFVADYLDALLITRENSKIAVKVVQDVVMKSEQIAEILSLTGLELKEIAAAMPRLRQAFREYLDAVEAQKKTCGCDDVDSEVGDQCEVSICCILREIGASYQKAQSAAIKIQAAFRGHYERMQLAERRGEIAWQRAAVTTIEILRKIGVSRNEAARAATVIQSVYRGYYTRRNLKISEERRREMGIAEPSKSRDMQAWLFALFDYTGLTLADADKAARIIQTAYRDYRKLKRERDEEQLRSQSKMSSSKRDELSTTSTDITSISKDSARKRDGLLSVTESSEDDSEIKVKALRFQSEVQVSILEMRSDAVVDEAEEEEAAETEEEEEEQQQMQKPQLSATESYEENREEAEEAIPIAQESTDDTATTTEVEESAREKRDEDDRIVTPDTEVEESKSQQQQQQQPEESSESMGEENNENEE